MSLLYTASFLFHHAARSCLHPSDSQGRDIPFSNLSSFSLPNGTQSIITSYQFRCSGYITAWHTYIQTSDDPYPPIPRTIRFQVWRPSPAVEVDGCYSLIGENVLSDITPDKNGLVGTFVASGDGITVAPKDVVGLYTQFNGNIASGRSCNNEVMLDGSYLDESVWYHTNTEQDPLVHSGVASCPFPIGRNLQSFTNSAPMLSIDMGKRRVQ